MSKVISLNNQLKRNLKKFFSTLKINLNKKDRESFELQQRAKLTNSISFSNRYGYATLIGNEAKKFRNFVEILSNIYHYSKNYNKKFAERCLRQAILSMFNPSDIKTPKEAVCYVEEKYRLNLTNWNVYFPVSGISFKRSAWSFGDVTFIKPSSKKFKLVIDKCVPVDINNLKIKFLLIEVKALDHHSAINVAKPVADLHIAVLNALSSISGNSKHNSPFSSYMKIGETTHSYIFTEKNKRAGWSRGMSLNLVGFNPLALCSCSFIKKFPIRKIQKSLRDKNDFYQKRVFPSLKWFGKAISQNSNEEAFLYYCLSYESILFEKAHKDKLMENLKARARKLLFTTTRRLVSSIDAYNSFDDLYSIRSKIVHRGGIDVSDDDMYLVRSLAMGCLFSLFDSKTLTRIKTSEEFEKWINK